ncbi:MAG: FxsA family protein [Sulfuricurvum sp.]|jgi:2-isopropylmalate synthase/UPF0716 protein FxsA
MIYFFLYFFLEVILTSAVASKIGGLMMFAEIMVSGLIGLVIIVNFRTTLVVNLMELKERRLSANGFYQRNVLALLSALLFIVPGILSDTIALLLQISLFFGLIINHFRPKIAEEKSYSTPTYSKDDHVIDAEIISDTPSLR